MNTASATSTLPTPETAQDQQNATFLAGARAFGHQYDYDVSYMEALLEASPGAYAVFASAMPMSRYQKAASKELIAIAKIATMRVEDCGPCLELSIKFSREAGVAENIIRGAFHDGADLNDEYKDVWTYAHAVAANEPMEPGLVEKLQQRYGHEAIAELAIIIAGVRLYPTIKRALGYAQSCSLMPDLM